MATPRQHHVRQSAIEIGDRFLKSFGMPGTVQTRGLPRVGRYVWLPVANNANISVERRDRELPMLAVDPFHVTRHATYAQENMIGHASS